MANAEGSFPLNDQPHFYKYMSADVARIVLENRTLRWSTPGTLNDPYDMQFDLHFKIERERTKKLALQKMWDAIYGDEIVPVANEMGELLAYLRQIQPPWSREEFDRLHENEIDASFDRLEALLPEMNAQFRSELAVSKILCLTEAPDNAVMWTHYAANHRGVVLKFVSVAGWDSPWPTARVVRYLEEMPRLMDEEFWSDMLAGRVSLDVRSLMERLIYTKGAKWAYEKEWRIYSGDGRNREALFEDINFGDRELASVIVGCRMPQEDREQLAQLVAIHYPHASLFEAAQDPMRFRLAIRPL